MDQQSKPTIGLALSGSGNRTTFYIGFLEVLQEAGITIDYIAACSGGALVAAAYACGTLEEFKKMVLQMNRKDFLEILTKQRGKGGVYSLDFMEQLVNEKITKGQRFEEVRPIMVFTSVDIENGEVVDLCMGDIARAVRITCTTPALFEPVVWGNRTLVDGGVISVVPTASLKRFAPDISISINLALTRNVFTGAQMSAKKIINAVKKALFLNEIGELIEQNFNNGETDNFEDSPKLFSVWGKSLDLAIYANKKYLDNEGCDLNISPDFKGNSRADLSSEAMKHYYELGRQTAAEYLPHIQKLVIDRQKITVIN